jgi:hypothetical protein
MIARATKRKMGIPEFFAVFASVIGAFTISIWPGETKAQPTLRGNGKIAFTSDRDG